MARLLNSGMGVWVAVVYERLHDEVTEKMIKK